MGRKEKKKKDHADEEGKRNPYWMPMTRMLSTKGSAQPCAALSLGLQQGAEEEHAPARREGCGLTAAFSQPKLIATFSFSPPPVL